MSRFTGPQAKGAAAAARRRKHHDAIDRNAHAALPDRRWHRQLETLDGTAQATLLAARGTTRAVAADYGVSARLITYLRHQASTKDNT